MNCLSELQCNMPFWYKLSLPPFPSSSLLTRTGGEQAWDFLSNTYPLHVIISFYHFCKVVIWSPSCYVKLLKFRESYIDSSLGLLVTKIKKSFKLLTPFIHWENRNRKKLLLHEVVFGVFPRVLVIKVGKAWLRFIHVVSVNYSAKGRITTVS